MTGSFGRSARFAALLSLFAGFAGCFNARADAVDFRAELDRNPIAMDESVSLKLKIQQDGNAEPVADPKFRAADFDGRRWKRALANAVEKNGGRAIERITHSGVRAGRTTAQPRDRRCTPIRSARTTSMPPASPTRHK